MTHRDQRQGQAALEPTRPRCPWPSVHMVEGAKRFFAPVEGGVSVGRTALITLTNARVIAVQDELARLLMSCRGARSLQEHCERAVASGGAASLEEAMARVGRLRELGLLVEFATKPIDDGRAVEGARKIDTVVVLTADRPQYLHRCLVSITRHCFEHERSVRLIVVDGSYRQSDENAAVIDIVRSQTGTVIDHFAPARIRRIAAALGRLVGDPELASWALATGTIGANRNLAMLLTASRHIVMSDDDILWDAWRPETYEGGVEYAGHEEPRRYQFAETRSAAIAATVRGAFDLLGEQEKVLGSAVPTVITAIGAIERWQNACHHVLATDRARCRIAVGMVGLAGDSARYCPYRWLFAEGHVRRELARPGILSRALRYREGASAVDRVTIMHEASCISHCVGIANSRLLPPFVPIGRGEDTLFGRLVSAVDGDAWFADLPIGVLHDSPRPAAYSEGEIPSADQIRVSEVILGLVQPQLKTLPRSGVEQAMCALGERLCDIETMSDELFEVMIVDMSLGVRLGQIRALQAYLARSAGLDASWRDACQRYSDRCAQMAANDSYRCAIEFVNEKSSDVRAMRRSIGRFGALLSIWPKLWRMSPGDWLSV